VTYRDQLTEAMTRLAQEPNSIFLGQAVAVPGTGMFRTLDRVSLDRRVELPVFENTQLGLCTGLALAGYLPVCIFPRINFLLEAVSQLVQHLDKLPLMSGVYLRVIIRTAVASPVPLDPGWQHLGNYTEALRMMLSTVVVDELLSADQVFPAYERALERRCATLLVEHVELYDAS
jgi:pyruvate/2-oxoglutarate/acetoin dehydrogenase E1 component